MGGNHPQKKRKKKRKEKVCGDQLVYIDDKNFEKHGWWISIHIFHHTLLISWQPHSFSSLYHTTCLNCTQMMSPDVTRCRLKKKNGGNWKENKNLRKSCWVHLNLSCLYYILCLNKMKTRCHCHISWRCKRWRTSLYFFGWMIFCAWAWKTWTCIHKNYFFLHSMCICFGLFVYLFM